MKRTRSILQILILPSALLLASFQAGASGLEVTNYGKKVPSTQELISALGSPAVGTRSLSDPTKKRSVSLGIEFKLNSYELTNKAEDVLNRLGGALASPQLKSHKFLIEGHTDATGGEQYNLKLSEQRAMTVRNYLVNVFNIEPARLQEVGKGEADLLDPDHPDSGVNRRVQIINMGE
ncbi:MAG: OmpA family protein [Arenicellales bacterium]